MKLIELEIHETRGIRDLLLKPDGKNLVVWGPNGSGKSAVVDAIDFLLTGRISRLMGKGTGGITLSKHGPHIDHKPEEAIVRAVIQLPKSGKQVELKRCMAHAEKLDKGGLQDPILSQVLTLARRGQHVLTRREILRYVTAEGSTRAEQIQELLDLGEVEEIRKALVKVEGDCTKAVPLAQSYLIKAQGAVNATIQVKTFSRETTLAFANQCRLALGGTLISEIGAAALKLSLTPPMIASDDRAVNRASLAKDIENLRRSASPEELGAVGAHDLELRQMLATVRANPKMKRDLERLEWTRTGLGLLDDSGACPLCDTAWEPDELRKYLVQKLSDAEMAVRIHARIKTLAVTILQSASASAASLKQVQEVVRRADLTDYAELLRQWTNEVDELTTALSDPLRNYPSPLLNSRAAVEILAPTEGSKILDRLHSDVDSRYPESTPEQDAWDALTRLEENVKALEIAEAQLRTAQMLQRRATALQDSFEKSRNLVLGRLYNRIRKRFVELYRELHGADEAQFDAVLEPDKAALNFEVDFRGRGNFPPHALHSEGHQDSMGLCLYLALAESLGEGLLNMVVLDDVVMSVDADHRRSLCTLLSKHFPNQQFIITTHDKTWATQLKHEGVVKPQGYAEFYNWHVDTGPLVNCEADVWDRIEEDLSKSDVSAASGRLRRASEEFFATVCDALAAQVTYKMSGRWELGDFLPSAYGQYRDLLKQAKKAAQAWGNKDEFDRLQEVESTATMIFQRSQAEQWAANASIHYNNWANLQPNDFQPLAEAFHDLFCLFTCSGCGAILRVATQGPEPVVVRCSCGKVNWNLTAKAK
jgi:recombinational DNA repair ATPase RecF